MGVVGQGIVSGGRKGSSSCVPEARKDSVKKWKPIGEPSKSRGGQESQPGTISSSPGDLNWDTVIKSVNCGS